MTQVKATLLTGGNHIETVSFPCSDDEIMRLTEQNEVGHKATVFINNLVGPKGLKSIEGTYANIHELNYKNTKKCLQNPRISAPRKSKQAFDSRSPHGERNQAG